MFLNSLIFFGQKTYVYTIPEKLPDGWETASLFNRSTDSTLIYRLYNKLLNEDHKIHSSLLVEDNKIVVEEYFGEYTANTKHYVRSVTKSIIAVLMGIAIEKGYIKSIDDPVMKYIKNLVPKKNPDKRKEMKTIRHLLTMSSGLDCNDWDKNSEGQEDRVYRKRDWLQYTLNLPMINDPGNSSFYCTMGVVLASEAISQASGLSIDAFAKAYLFEPLGIDNVRWGHTTTRKKIIPSANLLYMTPRDMAKIGKLILNGGLWNSKQVVSREWAEKLIAPQAKLAGLDYGFLWWNIPFKVNGNEIIAAVSTGNGGQYIMIFKTLNAVMVFTGGAYNSEEDKLPFAITRDIFLPTIINNK